MKMLFPTLGPLVAGLSPWRLLRRRSATELQRRSLLRLLAVATEENLPPSPLVETWAIDQRGAQRRKLRRLADRLRSGASLADAVEEVAGVLSDDQTLAVRFGAQSGTLAASLRQAIGQSVAETVQRAAPPRRTFAYGAVFVAAAAVIVAYLQLNIFPMFVQIFNDYSLESAPPLRWSIGFASWLAGSWPALLLGGALLLAMFFTRPGRHLRHAVLWRLFPSMRDENAAELLDYLSLATRAGRPIPGALSTLARYHYEPSLRANLLFARNEVEQGAGVWSSMRAAGLLTSPEQAVMDASEPLGNRSWALALLADSKRRHAQRRTTRRSQLLFVLMIVLFGLFVLCQALGVFASLAKLISALGG